MTSAWAFAVTAWGRPGVEAICLELQNVHGQCPALLLWRCWSLKEDRGTEAETLAAAVEVARRWEGEILAPLRTVRRRLVSPPEYAAGAAGSAVRGKILEAELQAEHALLDALEALTWTTGGGGEGAPFQAVLDLADTWRSPAPTALLAGLIAAL